MEQFDKIYDYPPELRGRFNSFITTEFDDSMTVEMQLRVLVKWIKKNIDLTNDMVDFLNDFIEKFDKKLYSTVYDILEEWSNSGYFSDLFDKLIMSKFLDYEPVKIHFPSMLTGAAGDCTIIEQHKKFFMIDTHYTAEFESIVKPLIQSTGLSYIDILLISHYHSDHYTNIENLINHGYLTHESFVYLPMTAPQVDNSTGQKLNDTVLLLEKFEIPFEIMTKDFELNFSKSVSIDVFNVDTSYYDGLTSDYNECSVSCLIKHNGSTALFTGDANRLAQQRMLDEGKVTSQIGLYKMHHHAIDNEYNEQFAKMVYPDNIVVETTAEENSRGVTGRSQFIGYCSRAKLFNCGNNKKPFYFISYGSGFENVNGTEEPHLTRNENIMQLYVDRTASGFQDGSKLYPFTQLHQAMGYIKNDRNTIYEIYVADGDYSELQNIANSNRTQSDIQLVNIINPVKITLGAGVKVGGRLIIRDCQNIIINEFNSTINNNSPVTIENSNVTFSKLVLSGNTSNSFTGVSILKSNVSFSNCDIKNVNNGISATYSNVYLRSTTITNVNKCIINNYSDITFTDNVTLTTIGGVDELQVTEGTIKNYRGYERVFQGEVNSGIIPLEKRFIKNYHTGYIINYKVQKNGTQISKGQAIRDLGLGQGITYPISIPVRTYKELHIGEINFEITTDNKLKIISNNLSSISENTFDETSDNIYITAIYYKTR